MARGRARERLREPWQGPSPPAAASGTSSTRSARTTGATGRRPLSIPAKLTIERFGAREVRISGGDSPHTADWPFVIDLDEVRETPHVLDWMSRLAIRGWGATPADLFTLARLLLDALGERQEPAAPD